MSTKVKVALFQMDCKIGATLENIEKCCKQIAVAAAEGCALIVFPECALSGYGVTSKEEALSFAIAADGPEIQILIDACKAHNIMAVTGYTEVRDGEVYNGACLLGPDGLLLNYNKMHMPYIGLDKFAAKGPAPLPPVETPIGKIALLICYDIRYPELCRYYATHGADMIICPTNWPLGSEFTRDVLPMARSFENMVYFLACNRTGIERGGKYIGGSRVVGTNGRIIVQAKEGEDAEEMLMTEIDVALARQKYFYSKEGDWSIDAEKDRRPDVFSCELVEQAK